MRKRFSEFPCHLLAFLICVTGLSAHADDWPTHLHDNARSGNSNETLSLPLKLRWSQPLPHPPKPAWPKPAKQDFWNRKTNLRPRVVFDRANGVVSADQTVVVNSSSDDQVRAFDTSTGKVRWSFFAEGPIRLAPTIWNDLVLFGSDDGNVYAVELSSGKLRWQQRPTEIGERKIPGNGRIISERPVRSGLLVDENGTVFFAAGIFPLQGTYFYSLNAATGEIVDQAAIEKSVQGYLQQRDGRIFAPTGRDPHGTSFPNSNRINQVEKETKFKTPKLPSESFSIVRDSTHQFVGLQDSVRAYDRLGNEIWSETIQGRAYDLAIANGSLFVSTDSGWLYAFATAASEANPIETALKPKTIPLVDQTASLTETTLSSEQESLLNDWRERKGHALFLNPSATQLLEWGSRTQLQIVAAVESPADAQQLRQRLVKEDLYGQVVVHVVKSTDNLSYGDNIFNVVVGGRKQQAERLLIPTGGVAVCTDGLFKKEEQHPGRWTHAYGDTGNTASSQDDVGGKLKLQWFGGPGPRNMVDRHMRTMPPLAADGMMFVPGLDRVIAVDAFNGLVQWEKELPGSTRIGILKDCGWMACGEHLLVAAGNRCDVFDRTTGTTEYSLKVPQDDRDWGYLALANDLVLGSSTLKNAARRTINRDAILEGAYSDDRPIVCSDSVFANDSVSRQLKWHYKTSGAILNPTIAANRDTVYFLENKTLDLQATEIGRITLSSFLQQHAKLVAIDLATGERKWTQDLPTVELAQNAYVLCNDQKVILVNSRNETTVHYDVRVFDAISGSPNWSVSQDNKSRLRGDHGEQDKHPVLVNNRLIVEPLAYDLDTGHKVTELNLGKRGYGCGTISASANALFFRSGNPASYQLDTNQIDLVTSVSRPGCWINMIPASGLLLIPEGSSGCTCNFAIQTSMAFTRDGD